LTGHFCYIAAHVSPDVVQIELQHKTLKIHLAWTLHFPVYHYVQIKAFIDEYNHQIHHMNLSNITQSNFLIDVTQLFNCIK